MDISLMCGFDDLETIEAIHLGSVESVRVFREACRQVHDQLVSMRTRIKKTDVFDWDAFNEHISNRMNVIPEDPSELVRFIERHGSHWRP